MTSSTDVHRPQFYFEKALEAEGKAAYAKHDAERTAWRRVAKEYRDLASAVRLETDQRAEPYVL
jgi:hypothetical protein